MVFNFSKCDDKMKIKLIPMVFYEDFLIFKFMSQFTNIIARIKKIY